MRKIFSGVVLFLFVSPLFASCPASVKCSIDGQLMFEKESYFNGGHMSKKFAHNYQGPNGTEEHYVIVSCD